MGLAFDDHGNIVAGKLMVVKEFSNSTIGGRLQTQMLGTAQQI